MEGVAAAAWQRWMGSPVRDAVLAVVLTVVLVFGSYGEGHPNQLAYVAPCHRRGSFALVLGRVPDAACAGLAVANRRAYAVSSRDRPEQDARRRIDEERLRIARELHDVVAHTMATINVQAGVAAHVLPTQPEAVAEALQAIKSASKDGLRELRAILNVLRQADDTDPVQPAPGLAQLDALVEGARRAGLPIAVAVT